MPQKGVLMTQAYRTPNVKILSIKCTKIDFGWGSAQDPAGGAYRQHSWI